MLYLDKEAQQLSVMNISGGKGSPVYVNNAKLYLGVHTELHHKDVITVAGYVFGIEIRKVGMCNREL